MSTTYDAAREIYRLIEVLKKWGFSGRDRLQILAAVLEDAGFDERGKR